ncbi:uncharacterized protein LOC126657042 [Mercurialis annua]|uniref:uncharacterized protein LOC126657042 n=1 Tax=Mercurialis annua TaxID=3986 RepID=UPI00215E80EC|nr:uncharacterized protein LOC126657042 [Mercurialis annua]
MIVRHKELREKIRQLVSFYEVASPECIYEDQDQDPTGSLKIGDITVCNRKTRERSRPGTRRPGKLIALLIEYHDCFAWSYDEMPGLDPNIAEHKLPLKSGFRPFRQPPRRMSREMDTLLNVHSEFRLETSWAKAIINVEPPNTKKQLQRLIGQINFLRRFIANTAGRLHSWSVLLRGKETDQFIWTNEQQKVFDDLKEYLAKPPVMTPPKPNKPLLLYLSAAHESLGCMLAQEDDGVERAVYYLSRGLTDTEIRYIDIEKMCLCLYFTCCKLLFYMLPVVVYVLSQTDIIKYILSKPYLRNRIGMWAIAMSEFTLVYVPQRAVKGQVLADFLADHPGITLKEETIGCLDIAIWEMWFDGSRTSQGTGAGVHIVSPLGASYQLSFKLHFECTNNQAEYESLIFGLEILAELGAKAINVKGDSLLVIKQVIGEFKSESELLWVQGDSPVRFERGRSNLHTGGITIDERSFSVYQLDVTQDWRAEILGLFETPDQANRRLRTLALNYVVLADELYKKGFEGLLFR